MSAPRANGRQYVTLLIERNASWLVCIASVLLAAPALIFRYLPMTDLPQYLAAASILQHANDPQWGYAQYYEPALWRTFSWLPYCSLWLLASVVPLELALRLLVFTALILQPLGILAMLAACGKPRLNALLVFPMVYSSQFFWGVLASNLSLGMALCACGLVMQPQRTTRQEIILCGLGIAIALTHVYGLAVLLVVAWVWTRRGRPAERRRWPWALWPSACLAGPWLWFALSADTIGAGIHPTLGQRLLLISDNLLGGFAGPYESLMLLALVGSLLILIWPVLPRSAQHWAAMSAEDRALLLLVALAAFLYLVLPLNTFATSFINERPAVLALSLAPLLLPTVSPPQLRRLAFTLPLLIGALATIHAGIRLRAFDAEAREFDAIVDATKQRATALVLTFDDHGKVSVAHPYVHFGAYLLARRGGYLAGDFFGTAWSLPVRIKPGAKVPPPVPGLPWNPIEAVTSQPCVRYDELLVRGFDPRELAGVGGFHHILVAHRGAWSLYRPPGAR